MNFNISNYDIQLHIQPKKILEKFTQNKSTDPEAGGIILGKIIDNQINILKLSIPTSLDRSSRTNFERNKLSAQIILDYEFHNSNGQLVYLGEWHTHPESNPTPSKTDLQMLRRQFKDNSLNTDFLILLIKGIKSSYIRIINDDSYAEVKNIKLI
jgi:integrative and conjugative element protein (TIGR02256 family)